MRPSLTRQKKKKTGTEITEVSKGNSGNFSADHMQSEAQRLLNVS